MDTNDYKTPGQLIESILNEREKNCTVCVENSALGLQPLEFKYLDKLNNEVEFAPFHPECLCRMRYTHNVKSKPKYFGEDDGN